MDIKIDVKKANVSLNLSRMSEQAKFVKGKDEDKSMIQGANIIVSGSIDDIFGFNEISVQTDKGLMTAEYIQIIFSLAKKPNTVRYATNYFGVDKYLLCVQCFLDSPSFVALSNAINYKQAFIVLKFMEPKPKTPNGFNLIEYQEMFNIQKTSEGLLVDLKGKSDDDYWLDVMLNFETKAEANQTNEENANELLLYSVERLTNSNKELRNYLWIILVLVIYLVF